MTQPPNPRQFLSHAVAQVDLSTLTSVPAGITFDNMRRRGIDVSRMSWTIEKRHGGVGRLFAKPASESHRIVFTNDSMFLQQMRPDGKPAKEVQIAFRELYTIDVLEESGSRKTPILKITARSATHFAGEGLAPSVLEWMRDRMLIEAAGLVWRPIFNVGKRTTRVTSDPDEEFCARWEGTSGRLVGAFLEQAVAKAEALKAALADRDWPQARSAAHWMKSSSAAVGAMQLSELYQRLEIEIDTKDYARARKLGPHLDAQFNSVRERLLRLPSNNCDTGVETRASPPPAMPDGPLPLSGVRILLAEDSKVNQEMVRACLEGSGCTLVVAENGTQAQQFYAEQPFDVVLMDRQMPDIDGFETTRLIREHGIRLGRNATPIIALTASALRDDRDRCIAAGMNDYISKPFDDADLLAMIAAWLPEASEGMEISPDDEEASGTDADVPDFAASGDPASAHEPASEPAR